MSANALRACSAAHGVTSAAIRHEPHEVAHPFLPRVYLALVFEQLLVGGFFIGDGNVFIPARTLQHAAAAPPAAPAFELAVDHFLSADDAHHFLGSIRWNGVRGAYGRAVGPADIRIA